MKIVLNKWLANCTNKCFAYHIYCLFSLFIQICQTRHISATLQQCVLAQSVPKVSGSHLQNIYKTYSATKNTQQIRFMSCIWVDSQSNRFLTAFEPREIILFLLFPLEAQRHTQAFVPSSFHCSSKLSFVLHLTKPKHYLSRSWNCYINTSTYRIHPDTNSSLHDHIYGFIFIFLMSLSQIHNARNCT